MTNQNLVPTKYNLLKLKRTLSLAHLGSELMDRKRKILIQESKKITGDIDKLINQINKELSDAYRLLLKANSENGMIFVRELSRVVPLDNKTSLRIKSFMGCELPRIKYEDTSHVPYYSFSNTTESLDKAMRAFEKVKILNTKRAELEASENRLKYNIKKISIRTNALTNITIPKYTELVKSLSSSIEEKEREEFSRLKSIKKKLTSQ